MQSEALQAFEAAEKLTGDNDIEISYRIGLEIAEQRRLERVGSFGSGFIGPKEVFRCLDVLDAALEQTGKWDHGRFLRTKVKVQVAKGQYKNAIETYFRPLAVLQVRKLDLVARFAKLSGSIVSKAWSRDVTHVIASTDGNGACKRTLKSLMAILEGRWILNINWIKGCLKAMSPVSEEPYEIKFDINGSREGPKNGWLRIMQKAPKLLEGSTVYISGEFEDSCKGYLEDLLLAAGGGAQY
ncbi:hypothetical protein AMTR_s00067p00181040 [Amborella trichopoda]|uniref:BRCT domain-containing protein n=1 Tax=Amborella trichopoda TaxID=13333 RepID=U5D8W7_AMBTC|nr:hypothetical protein AMTR_s00067p00181040 [Amborella trichopoda]